MKKTFTLLAFVFFVATSFAQIVINESDMPVVGDTIRSSIFIGTDSLYGANYMTTGADHNWNFANIGWDLQKVDTFMLPADTYFASHFTTNSNLSTPISISDLPIPANIPVELTVQNAYAYFNASSTKFEQIGMGAKVGIPVISIPPTATYSIYDSSDVFYKLPLAFTNKDTTNSHYLFSLNLGLIYGSVNIYESKKRINEVDGWGSITTPLGTFDAIRLKSVSFIKDSMIIQAMSIDTMTERLMIEYIWLTKTHHIPVMKVTENINNTDVRVTVQYIDNYKLPRNWSINENNQESVLNIYPNPCKDFVKIVYNASNNANISVFDMYGNKVSERSINPNSTTDINVSEYAKGIYTARITDSKNKPVTKLFVVQ